MLFSLYICNQKLQLTKMISKTLSVRISLMVVLATAALLTVSLSIALHYSQKAVKIESLQDAAETLEYTTQHIDNVLLSVEQAAGNIYFDMTRHMNEPERMFTYSRKLVENNPYVAGCAIAFEPYYYKDRGQYFMAYVHHNSKGGLDTSNSPIIQSETFGNVPYNQQVWYTEPIRKRHPCWVNPLKEEDTEGEAIITFCLPIYDVSGQPVGVMGVDVSLTLLSTIVMAAKPTPNSYATLLGSDGSYIVHPDSNKLFHQTVFTFSEHADDPSVKEVAEAMMAGETDYKFFKMNGRKFYAFYKPFQRSAIPGRANEDLKWSIAIVFPEDDVLGDYHSLSYTIPIIAFIGLLLLLALCRLFTHRQLLPLRMLAKSAQRIAEGHYDLTVPDTRQEDEVGRLQTHFQEMQKSLSANMDELQGLTTTLQERGEVLAEACEQAKEADQMKTAVLHNMSHKMTEPVSTIASCVDQLCTYNQEMEQEEAERLADEIQAQGKVVTELLKDLLDSSMKNERQKIKQ